MSDNSPPSSEGSKLNPSSLGLHNKTSRRQNRQNLTTSWIASQEGQELSSVSGAAAPAAQSQFVTPTITVTQSDEEVVPEPSQYDSHEEEVEEGRENERVGHTITSPPLSTATKHSGHHRLSATVIIDQPIPEEEEDEGEEQEWGERVKEKEEKSEGKEEEDKEKQKKNKSRWSGVRGRALSYPTHSLAPPVMLQLHTPEPLGVEREGEERERDKGEGASGGMTEDRSNESGEHSVSKFVQMAVMAKKWKMRSNTEEINKTSSKNSRDMLFNRQKRRPLIEMPRCLKLELLEEAHHIVHKTLQMYRAELGLRHKLTLQAEQHYETLAHQLDHSH